MLRTLFQWFDAHPESYWVILAFPSFLFLAFAAVPGARGQDDRKVSFRNELSFVFLLLATLVAWRWPYLLNANPYNPDESQLIAGAITLTADPIFWKAVDGTTSGPLNFYALLPLHWLGAPLDYFGARLTGLLLVWIAIIGCYRLIRSWYGVTLGRLSVLPIAAFFAAASDADFVHYSSEHLSLALLAISAWGIMEIRPAHLKRALFLCGGLVAGMLPWAKLQTGPIAATLVLFGLWKLWADRTVAVGIRRRLGAELLVASVIPSLVIVSVVGASGHFGDLYRDYLLQNLEYIDQEWSTTSAIHQLWKFSWESGNLPAYVGVTLFAAGLTLVRKKFVVREAYVQAAILTLVAVACVMAPKRASLHYTLLTVVPLAIWMGASLGELRPFALRAPPWKISALIAGGALFVIVGVRLYVGAPAMFGHFSDHWRRARTASGNITRALSKPGDRLAVWGYMDRVHVDSGLAQATRESNSFEQIEPSRQREHYRQRYVADLKKNRPAVFIDASGPGAFLYPDRALAGHETVPALAEFVRENYTLLTDLGYARIYVHPERLDERRLSESELWRLIVESRRDGQEVAPISVQPRRLARKKIHGRSVRMMLPPAEMVWALNGTEREVFLEYGFDPQAYKKGHGNGADIIVELQAPGAAPLLLFNRSLDPHRRPDDRGNLKSKIVLPPFRAGTKFIIRTTPGEFVDNAWDWIYVGSVDWVRSPFYSTSQFPGFSRVPHLIEADQISIVENPEGKLLMTHAPAAMRFTLTGREQRWQFDYGFQPGAHTGEGRTDGATFLVELRRAGESTTLFSRKLNPVASPDDQGRQHADVRIPPTAKGDELVLRIDPGPSSAWDWTYITHFQVEQTGLSGK